MSDLERVLSEQRECREYLNGDGPDHEGAALGLSDLVHEECLIGGEYQKINRYARFMEQKAQLGDRHGFKPLWMPSFLFDFQAYLAEWNLEAGRSATLADCGMGKTPISLVWAENVVRFTNKPVLFVTPVAPQAVREAEKFQVECYRSRDGIRPAGARIIITNYERLHYFDPKYFAGMVLDESSILKSFDGARRSQITEFMRVLPYRLLATATAAPNDYIELGTSSEALGQLGYLDMLNRFFKNDQQTVKPVRQWRVGKDKTIGIGVLPDRTDKWRFKGHAEIPFMQWVCSWARAGRKPSDFGNFSDEKFILPPLIERQHLVRAMTLAPGMLFSLPAIGLQEQREERRRTIKERCEKLAELSDTGDAALIWCHLNPEGDLLEKLVPGAVQISGKDSDEAKEEKFMAFISGQARALITKEKIGAWGWNFQHCNHVLGFPSHSFEGYYQGLRRVLRFGQKRPVTSDTVTTEGEQTVLENRQRKAAAADKLFSSLVAQMRHALSIERSHKAILPVETPLWLR